jgi:hypothetical protein
LPIPELAPVTRQILPVISTILCSIDYLPVLPGRIGWG